MNPFSVSPETDSEARNQTALFAWLAMCGHYGRAAADDERCHTVKGYASAHYQLTTSRPISHSCELSLSEVVAVIHMIPNGAHLAGGARAGATLIGQGLRRGVPDICVPVPMPIDMDHDWQGMWLELKDPAGMVKFNRAKPEDDTTEGHQKRMQEKLKRAGHVVTTEVGWINSKEAIARYLQL